MNEVKVSKNNMLPDSEKRKDYLIVGANAFSQSLGQLNLTEKKIVMFLLTFVEKKSKPNQVYYTSFSELQSVLGLNIGGGKDRLRIASYINSLNEKTSIAIQEEDGLLLTSFLDYAKLYKNSDLIEFKFSEKMSPYIYALKKNFFVTRISMINRINKEHTYTLYTLYLAYHYLVDGLVGTMEEWQRWFLGKDRKKMMPAYVFKRDVLKPAMEDLENQYGIEIELENLKNGRKISGYKMIFKAVNESSMDLIKEELGVKKPEATKEERHRYDNMLYQLQSLGVSWAFKKEYYDENFPFKKRSFVKKKDSKKRSGLGAIGEFELDNGDIQTALDIVDNL